MKRKLMAVVMAAALIGTAGCANRKKGDDRQAEQTGSVFGTYKGTFPCADCDGIDVDLTINADGTYYLKYLYRDEEVRLVEEVGTYSMPGDTLVVTVTPSSGEKTYYKYVQGDLVLSDSAGTVNTGELAAFYVLKK